MYWLIVTALAYFSFLEKIEKYKYAKFHFKTFLFYKIFRYLASFFYKMRKMESKIFSKCAGLLTQTFGKVNALSVSIAEASMQKTFQKKWSPKCLIWQILGVLNIWIVFCLEAPAMETDSAFTFPKVWVSSAEHLESPRHPTGDVFVCIG